MHSQELVKTARQIVLDLKGKVTINEENSDTTSS